MEKITRIEAIDQFRGFAILLMVVANFLYGVKTLPAWMKHAPGVGLTIVDLIAPFFIFAIALTYRPSWQHRVQSGGPKRAAEHFVKRYLAIAGIGFLLTTVDMAISGEGWREPWGVLQAIGAAGLIALAVIPRRWAWRLAVGIAMLGVYQWLLQAYWLEDVCQASHGGLKGSLGWGAMLILGTAIADLNCTGRKGKTIFPLAALAFLAAGIALTPWVPVAKGWVSASYVLVSVGASALLFQVFDCLSNGTGFSSLILSAWGHNPLTLYLLHLALLGFFFLPRIPSWYAQAPWWLTASQILSVLAILSGIGILLWKKGWTFSL